jgi:hypothetical protein
MDPTEDFRRRMIETDRPAADLAADDGPRWDTAALRRDFEVIGFTAPFVTVIRRADGVRGTLEFVDRPRWYFDFIPQES